VTTDESATLARQLERIVEVLLRHRFRFSCEKDLQRGVEQALISCGLSLVREKVLSEGERADFWVAPIAVEVKIKGGLSVVTRQLMRYADLPMVEAVVLVTTKMQHKNMPPEMRGKPVRVVYLPPM